MKQAIISPVYDLELSDRLSHTYLILSWLCKKDPQYKSHWTNIKKKYDDAYVILDNGANESKLSSDQEILSLALEMNVDEIVAPDEYLNAESTIEKSKKFLDKYYDEYIKGRLNVQAVLQGETKDEFMKCFDAFMNDDRINVIGIGYRNLYDPFLSEMEEYKSINWDDIGIKDSEYLKNSMTFKTFYSMVSRIFFLKNYINFDIIREKNKKIHLLGLTNPYEIKLISNTFKDEIRSCDSAAPIQAAQSNVMFDITYGVSEKPQAFLNFEERLSSEERNRSEYNIQVMKDWLNE